MTSANITKAMDLIKNQNITAYAAAKIIGINVTTIYNSLIYQKHTGRIIQTKVTDDNRAHIKSHFDKKFIFTPTCWPWIGFKNLGGYGLFAIGGHSTIASRAAYQIYVGQIPTGLHVLHKCDNRLCVNPDHLFLGTNGDNMADKKNKGRACYGSKNASTKLTEDQVILIRLDSRSCAKIAIDFGVNRGTIQAIKTRKTWINVK